MDYDRQHYTDFDEYIRQGEPTQRGESLSLADCNRTVGRGWFADFRLPESYGLQAH